MNVKVCNFRSNEFGNDFKESLTNTGFAVVTHHGIDEGFIREAQQAWRLFFLNDPAYKNGFSNPKDGNEGYKGMRSEKAVGAKVADLKEFFHWRPGKRIPTEVAALTMHMFAQLEDMGLQMLKVIENDECCTGSNNTILRTLYYPAMDFAQEPGAVRAAAHEDINFITLLIAASAAGLQVKDSKGTWYDVPHEENSIVVNIGDMLQLSSRGKYRSTTHRVVNPSDSRSDRISMPMFVHPHADTLLSDGFTAGEFLAQRIAEIYAGGGK